MRYWAFKDQCAALGVHVPQSGASVTFWVPMAPSWSKKKKAKHAGKPHQQRPDVDNYLKALLDAVYEDDSCVWQISIEKRWAYKGAIEVR